MAVPIDFHGLDIIRGRDCVVFINGDTTTVTIDNRLAAGGWIGGQGVQWAPSTGDERVITYSKGLYGGFMLWGSDEAADQYTSMTGQFLRYREGVMVAGRALISTLAYESYTYASRVAHAADALNPLVPLVYTPSDLLYFSLRGLWTKEDELTLSSDPLAPAFFTGFCAQKPKANNSFFLGIQTSM